MIDYKTFAVEVKTALYDCGNRLRRRNIMSFLPELYDKTVLEIGCGIGDFWITLKNFKKAVYKKYIALDISFLNLEKSRQLALNISDERIILIQADVLNLPLSNKLIDIIICTEVLEHLDDLQAMQEINRVLRPGGYLLITVPYLGKPVIGWGHLRHYDLERLKFLSKSSGFDLQKIKIFGRFHEISWVKIKRILYRVWGVWKKVSGTNKIYYESQFHRSFVMPIMDKILFFDNLFSFRKSIGRYREYKERNIGYKEGNIVALMQKVL